MSSANVTLGDRVARRRDELGITQRELADRCGCTVSAISGIECGRTTSPTMHLLDNLATALDVPLEWLVRGKAKTHGGAR